jgi:uncharacterized protein (TIGR02145 family)
MKNLFYTLFIGLFLLSCGTENKPTYTITTTVSPTEGGTISLTPAGRVYSEDEVVTVTGIPSTGWRFVRWEGDWVGTVSPVNVGVNKNYSIVGIFEKKDYPLTVNIEGFGEVEERVIQQKTTDYPYQTVVELTPVPDNGWRFVEWSGDLSGNEAPKQITVDKEKTVTAKFERKNYPLTITIVGEGTVKETVLPQRTTQYPFESVVVLEPMASNGWEFVRWSGNLSGNTVPEVIVVNNEKNVTATFQKKTYKLNISVEGNGAVNLEPQQERYSFGTNVILTPVPAEGWEFVEWNGDLTGSDVPNQIMMDGDKSVEAVFKIKTYSINTTLVGNARLIIEPEQDLYSHGTIVTLTARPGDFNNESWVFAGWGGDVSGKENPVTIEMLSNTNITATFERYLLKDGEVYNNTTGRVWMDKNLGASRVALSPTDFESFGDLYQWGRRSDGHEKRNSTTSTILSSTNTPPHSSFIIVSSGNYDWRNPQNNNLWQGVNGINNPCPIDYRIPTISEWKTELQSWSSNDVTGAFDSSLKLPLGGIRNWNNGVKNDEKVRGYYWSSSSANYRVQYIYFDDNIVNTDNSIRANGLSVRCIKH